MKKQELSYYDMGDKMANMYKPIDEYLAQTKRFKPSAILRTNIGYLLMIGPFWLMSIFLFISVITEDDMQVGVKVLGMMITFVLFMFTGYLLLELIRAWNVPDPDMLSCRNILDRDGPERVYKDFQTSKQLGDRLRIGERYLFIKNETLVRISDIYHTDLDEVVVSSDDGQREYYYYTVFVRDELGERKYHLKDLSRELRLRDALHIKSEAQLKQFYKNSTGYRALDEVIQQHRKRIETLDIPSLPEG